MVGSDAGSQIGTLEVQAELTNGRSVVDEPVRVQVRRLVFRQDEVARNRAEPLTLGRIEGRSIVDEAVERRGDLLRQLVVDVGLSEALLVQHLGVGSDLHAEASQVIDRCRPLEPFQCGFHAISLLVR